MIERTSRDYVLKTLEKNKNNWNILDIGCNQDAVKFAQTAADIINFSKSYNDKKIVLIKDKNIPFRDNEFNFVYVSHIMEHTDDFIHFID